MKWWRALALVLALLIAVTPVLGVEMTAADRVQQAKAYQEQGRLEDALTALEFAQALAPGALDVVQLTVAVLTDLERPADALAYLDGLLVDAPARIELHLLRARVLHGMEKGPTVTGASDSTAYDALRRAAVACGGDQCFTSQYANEYKDLLWQVAESEVDARRYDQALSLYALLPPDKDDPAYQRALASRGVAQAEWTPIPGVPVAAFEQALEQDQLVLREGTFELRVPWAEYVAQVKRYDRAVLALGGESAQGDNLPPETDVISIPYTQVFAYSSFVSLSPDGTRILVISDGVPAVFALDGSLFQMIAPDQNMNRDYYALHYQRLIDQVEDAGVVWSQDGQYIALAFPRHVLAMMQLTSNVILIDVGIGTASAVDKALEQQAEVKSAFSITGGAALRATFSLDDQHLLYEVYGGLGEDNRLSEIRSLDLATGDVQVVSTHDFRGTTVHGLLVDTPSGVLHNISDVMIDGPRGLAFRGAAGDQLVVRNPDDDAQATIQPILLDVQGDTGLLHTTATQPMNARAVLQPFPVSSVDASVFDKGLAINPDEPAMSRLTWLNLAEGLTHPSAEDAEKSLVVPDNGVLSPDGSMLLLASARFSWQERVLFLCDLNTLACGIVDASAIPEESLYGRYLVPLNQPRGLRWSGNNRLLIEVDGKYRLFELAILDK